MSEYKPLKLNLSAKQQRTLLNGKAIKLSRSQVNNGPIVLLHKSNYNKIMKMKDSCNLSLSKGEIMASAERNNLLKNSGGGFFSDIGNTIWSGLKGIGRFVSDNATPLLDIAEAVGSTFAPGAATLAREAVRGITGKSIKGMNKSKGKFII
tara:strand:- start:148 stop:600 length:453 start_codon:yes stop_codon:yes gene_type:complete